MQQICIFLKSIPYLWLHKSENLSKLSVVSSANNHSSAVPIAHESAHKGNVGQLSQLTFIGDYWVALFQTGGGFPGEGGLVQF